MARRDAASVRLLTRNGIDWSGRFPLIAAAAGDLKVRSCLIDGEAVACDGDGLRSTGCATAGRTALCSSMPSICSGSMAKTFGVSQSRAANVS
jgi:hypothetical protein